MSKKLRFRTPFNSQHAKRSQTLLKSVWQHFYHFSQRYEENRDDHKHSLCNSENLQQSIEMQLSKKPKKCSHFFTPFLKSTSNFQHFEKKMTGISYVFPELPTAKNAATKKTEKHRFKILLES